MKKALYKCTTSLYFTYVKRIHQHKIYFKLRIFRFLVGTNMIGLNRTPVYVIGERQQDCVNLGNKLFLFGAKSMLVRAYT